MVSSGRVRPRPYQQQCPSNVVECYKLNDSFDNAASTLLPFLAPMLPFSATMSNEISSFRLLSTKSKQIEHVQFVSILLKGRNFVRHCRPKRQHCCRNWQHFAKKTATMSKQHSTLSKGRNFTIESFDIVAVCGNKVECCFDIVATWCGRGLRRVASRSGSDVNSQHTQVYAGVDVVMTLHVISAIL